MVRTTKSCSRRQRTDPFLSGAPRRLSGCSSKIAADEAVNDAPVFSADGKLLLTQAEQAAHLWDVAEDRSGPSIDPRSSVEDLVDGAKVVVPRCLTIQQRKDFLLDPEPPSWCIAQSKFPYGAEAWTKEGVVDSKIALALGDYADAAVRAGDFAKALKAADRGIKFDPELLLVKLNRAHALMFLERTDEARGEYLAHRGKEMPPFGNWEDAVKSDFSDYRRVGLKRKLMAKIEGLFESASPP